MGKILKIEDNVMFIGIIDTKQIIKIAIANANYEAKAGDIVEIYQDNELTIVSLADKDLESEENFENFESHEKEMRPNNYVNKTTYLLLCLFFGGIGIHKFYSGHIILGLLYLVFCFTYIPIIISLIEFIVACTVNADENGCIRV
ncbi:MAG: TM2 domain-containing protein [Erysipelotrichaceae bacterium]